MSLSNGLCFLGCLIFCVGCSSSSSSSTPQNDSENETFSQAFVSGSSCVEADNSVVIGMTDEDGNFVPVDSSEGSGQSTSDEDLIDCLEMPAMDLTTAGTQMIGNGSAMLADREIEITGAFSIEIVEHESAISDHTGIAITLHDGILREQRRVDSAGTERVDYGVYDASFALSAELYSAGSNGLFGQTFDYSSADDISAPSLQGINALLYPTFAIDIDGDGIVTSAEEFFLVTAGSMTLSGTLPVVSVSFDLILSDGRTVSGSYQGDVHSIEQP